MYSLLNPPYLIHPPLNTHSTAVSIQLLDGSIVLVRSVKLHDLSCVWRASQPMKVKPDDFTFVKFG